MRIRWIGTTVQGTWHNNANGIRTGEIASVDEHHARRYVKADLAELVDEADIAAHF
jgi:hypothetical protein